MKDIDLYKVTENNGKARYYTIDEIMYILSLEKEK